MSIHAFKGFKFPKADDQLKHLLNPTLRGAVKSLLRTLSAKDRYTHGHAIRGAQYALMIGRELELEREALIQLELGALLHDIGKIGIPDKILLKPGPLTDQEYEVMKKHPTISGDIVSTIDVLAPIVQIVTHHQERCDGKGYPDGLKGDSIPLLARIVCIADAFDAMTSDRPYRKALSEEKAISELTIHSGTQFDASLVKVFLKAYGAKKHVGLVSEFFEDRKRKQAVGE